MALKTNWNLSPLFDSDTDSQILKSRDEVISENQKFINKWKNRDDFLTNPIVLEEALNDYENLQRFWGAYGSEGYYFYLRISQDQDDPTLKAAWNTIDEKAKKIINETQFFTLRLSKVNNKIQQLFLKSPNLSPYHHFLEKLFAQANYVLSDLEERILNLKSQTSYENWVQMVEEFLSTEQEETILENGKKVHKTLNELLSLINSTKKEVRVKAGSKINNILHKYDLIAEHEINSVLGHKKIDDYLRKTTRPDFLRHLQDDIDSEIVDSLIDSVSKRFSISERFYILKANLLNQKQLEYFERNVEYKISAKKYSYQQSVDLVKEVFLKLDKEIGSIFIDFTKNGFIDVYPKKGKRGGAFCIYWLPSLPTYILLNHNGDLNDVLTLAHEAGHGINNELIKKKQNSLNFGTPTSTAEVASTFMEDFVLQEIMKDQSDEEKLSLMMMKLNTDISTIFRQVSCYKFETELHQEYRKKGYLSKSEIGKIFQANMKAYMGKGVKQSPGSENWWIYWSHIRNFFYVYSYASGLLISKSLQALVKENPLFINKVKEFLSSGTSDSPRNIFLKLGIDIADKKFWDKGLSEVESLLEETEKLAIKLKKVKDKKIHENIY